jgi:hypothetical protein
MALALHFFGGCSTNPVSIYRLKQPAFFAGLFTDFIAVFLVEIFLVGEFPFACPRVRQGAEAFHIQWQLILRPSSSFRASLGRPHGFSSRSVINS